MKNKSLWLAWGALLLAITACGEPVVPSGNSGGGDADQSETATVIRAVDGDTIVVRLDGREERIRYVGVNTPESDEACGSTATEANSRLVAGQTVRLERDTSDRDRFDRLLRYVYVGETMVNRELIVQGYAEAVLYEPDDRYYQEFVELERMAALSGRGCHPTGIFDDGSTTR